MTISADHLLRLVSSSALSKLVAQRGQHRHTSLMDDVFELNEQVRDTFPELDPDAYRLVVETQRYVGAREQFVGRLLLDPEEYLEAARTASVDALAEMFARPTDPPTGVRSYGVIEQRTEAARRRRERTTELHLDEHSQRPALCRRNASR